MASTHRSGHDMSDKVSPAEAQRILDDYNRLRISQGLSPVSGMKLIRTIRISGQAHAGLVKLAAQYGYMYDGKGNLSKLLEMIGLGYVRTLPPGVDVDVQALLGTRKD